MSSRLRTAPGSFENNANVPIACSLVALLFVCLLSTHVGARGDQAAAPAFDPQSVGPKLGARAPDFTLPDQHGTPRSLRSTFGPKGAVLVFFRSADW
jgi:cytochrome oxidase Cu insertion factor (SCO1/SenC/PrrC family)